MSLHKKISKKKSSHVGWLNARIHWLTKYKNKKCHAHSDMHSITWPCTLFNNHPYVSSSKVPLLLNTYTVHAYGVQQPVRSVSSVFPTRKCKGKSQLRSKLSSKGTSPEKFMTALGCLKKLRRKTELLTFDRFRLATLKMVTIHVAIIILQTGAGSIAARCTFRHKHLVPGDE